MWKKAQDIASAFKDAGKLLAANDPLRMAGATAFFTTFALPPMLIIIVRTLGLFFDRRKVGREIMGKVGKVLGNEGRDEIRSVIRGVRSFQLHPLATALIFVFLLFVATTLFIEIKNSINQLWRIRVNKKRRLISVLIARLKSVAFILFTGALFLAVMAIELLQAYFGPYIAEISPQLGNYVHGALNHLVSLAVVTTWFFTLFRFLPDGRPRPVINFAGALVAGVLFSIGKYVLRWALSGNIKEIYGTSGAFVVILLFVFYSSLMLYFSAAFTAKWGKRCGAEITPLPHASRYRITISESPAVAVEGTT